MTRRYEPDPPPQPQLDHFLLGGAPDDIALITGTASLTYRELTAAVEQRAEELGSAQPGRGVVFCEMSNNLPSVLTYLASLALGRPVLLVQAGEPERQGEIIRRYAPDVGESPPPHRDLALLLSTSGSTGSPKLVRLSRNNVLANAHSIATYLNLTADDRGITSLPLHYCYGLSVLNSHLVAGAAVVLTEHSVSTECFWELASRARITGLAGVPYTFELLTAVGFAERDLPRLRYVTQAGGRMAPKTVTAFAELGERRGWDLYVMYGQTEATARIAYLPPQKVRQHPGAIGVAVPGGRLRLDPLPEAEREAGALDDVGELVYAGPNVMMGYAHTASDLTRPAELAELRTGDLARRCGDGLYEIVGRRDRVAKLFGLRIDLDRLEAQLGELGLPTKVLALDEQLHGFSTRSRDLTATRTHLAGACGIPAGAVRVHHVERLPTTGSGKCDYAALRRQALAADGIDGSTVTGVDATSLRDLYAVLLGRPEATTDDSFVSLGGDSLSFVEVTTRLGRELGALPADWPKLSVAALAATARPRRRGRRWVGPVEIGVVLRALAILMIVTTHTDLYLIPGGAHVLLAVVGYNLARLVLPREGRGARTRHILGAVAAVAVPSTLWILGAGLVTGDYRLSTAFYLNEALGEPHWTLDWQFWFLGAIVWGLLAVAVLLAIPVVDRWQRHRPFAAAVVVVVITSALRYATTGVTGEGVERYCISAVLCVIALGWAAAEARTAWQRTAVTAAAYVTMLGFFDDPQRELIVVASVVLLLWARPVPMPHVLVALLSPIATASLWIYLTHWQVYPQLEAAGHPLAAIVASVLVGIGAYQTHTWALGWLKRLIRGAPTSPDFIGREDRVPPNGGWGVSAAAPLPGEVPLHSTYRVLDEPGRAWFSALTTKTLQRSAYRRIKHSPPTSPAGSRPGTRTPNPSSGLGPSRKSCAPWTAAAPPSTNKGSST